MAKSAQTTIPSYQQNANLTVNATARLSHLRSGDSQGYDTFLGLSVDN